MYKEYDEKILELLQARARHAKETTAASETPVPRVSGGVTEQLAAAIEKTDGPLATDALTAVYREIISVTDALCAPVRIAYMGPPGSFTHQACIRHFGHAVETVEKKGITDVFRAVSSGDVKYGVVPVENSNEGAVTHTLDMFVDAEVIICAEEYLDIHHAFMSACPREDITRVYSHPMAFPQCRQWIAANLGGVELVDTTSTAQAAAHAAKEDNAGAIASILCAELYALNVHEESIEDHTENMTRFLIIGTAPAPKTEVSKTSILFAVKHEAGALFDALAPFREKKINLTKIESRPSKLKAWEYYFYVDFEGHTSNERVRAALDALHTHCHFVKILGSYPA